MKPAGAVRLEVRPITLRKAEAFVGKHHRHHKRPPGGAFALQAYAPDDQTTRAVAIAGRPLARLLDDGLTLEILRVATDGTPNACSLLYSACRRVGQAMGYRSFLTYTLAEEDGTSLVAAGWQLEARTRGGKWARNGRPRPDSHPTQPKLRWSPPKP